MDGEGLKEKIIKLLSRHDYGLTIEDIARSLEINRMTASKYLAILEATKQIAVREVGKAKLHYPKASKNQKWLKLNNYKSSCGLNSISFVFLLFLFFTSIIFLSVITTANPNGGNQNFEISVIKDYTEKLIILEIQGPPLTDFSLTLINPENKSISPKDDVSFQTDQEGKYELHLIGFVPGYYLVKLASNGTEYTEDFEIDPFVESECNRSFLEYRPENATNVTETNESVAGDYVWDICRDFVESSVTKEEVITEIVENRTFVESENVTNETIERSFVEEELNITEITENRTFLENESVTNETVINETLERSFVEEELNITEIAENMTFVEREVNITNVTETNESIPRLFIEKVVEFLPEKKKFGMNEKPKFKFTSKKIFSEQGKLIEEFAEPEVLDVFVYGPDQKLLGIKTDILKVGNGEYEIELSKGRAFRPGLYRIRMEVSEGLETYEMEDQFLWGVLAINTHKSIYLENEQAFIGIAVLDNEGRMVCDADVTLEITDPHGTATKLTTSDGTIKISKECEVYGVTNLPDYYAYYAVNTEGTYTMNLKAVTRNGIRTMTDTFLVKKQVDFDVERDGPTRIYPPAKYQMVFTIKANRDYEGEINEYVPSSFAITPQQDLTPTTSGDTKTLTWNKKLIAGETYQLAYEFDAPDVSPYLFILGPLEIGAWEEARQWMTASDAPGLREVDMTLTEDVDVYKSGGSPATQEHYVYIEFDISSLPGYSIITYNNATLTLTRSAAATDDGDMWIYRVNDQSCDVTNDAVGTLDGYSTDNLTQFTGLGSTQNGQDIFNITDIFNASWLVGDSKLCLRLQDPDEDDNTPTVKNGVTETSVSTGQHDGDPARFWYAKDGTTPAFLTVNYNDSQSPNASLGTNPTAGYSNGGTFTFDLKCSDNDEVDTLQLWGNWSGGWSAKETNSSPANNTFWNVTLSGIAEGSWKWGVFCNDSAGNGDWSDVNRTFTSNLGPKPTNVAATPQKAKNGTNINITATITDSDGVSTARAMLYYPNGSFWQNVTMTNTGDVYWNNTVTANFDMPGRYNVTIWANDTGNRINSSEKTWFAPYLNLSKEKNITINGSFTDWSGVTVVTDNGTDAGGEGIALLEIAAVWGGGGTTATDGTLSVYRYNQTSSDYEQMGSNISMGTGYISVGRFGIGQVDNRSNRKILLAHKDSINLVRLFNWTGTDWDNFKNKSSTGPNALVTGDLIGDSTEELAFTDGDDDAVYVYTWNGTDWEQNFSASMCTFTQYAIAIGNVDGDDENELLFQGTDCSKIVVFDVENGQYVNNYNISWYTPGILDDFGIGDTDGDGTNEVVACGGSTNFTLYEWNGAGYTKIWEIDMDDGAGTTEYTQSCEIGNIDEDSRDELVGGVTGELDKVMIFENDSGTMTNTFNLTGMLAAISDTRLGDLDGDGEGEIVTFDSGGNLNIYNRSTGDTYTLAKNITEPPSVTTSHRRTAVGNLFTGNDQQGGGGDFDITNMSLANNDSYLFARIGVNGSIDVSEGDKYYRVFISTDDSVGNETSPEGEDLPFKYDYRVQVNGSACYVFNYTDYGSNVSSCLFNYSGAEMEVGVNLTVINLSAGDNANITFQTGSTNPGGYDSAPDGESFLSYDVSGAPGDQSPTASLGTNPVPSYGDTDGSLTFDLKCSDDNETDTLKLWGNWSGWHANQTNSSPGNDAWWNVTVSGIPEGMWKWDAWCNDTIGQEDWSAVNRTFTVDLTNPQIGSKYINESGTVDTDTIVCLNVSGVSDTYLDTVWTMVTQSNGSVFNATMLDNGDCAGIADDGWYSVNVNVGDSAGLFSYNTTYVNDSSGRMNTNTTELNLTVQAVGDTSPTASLGTNPVLALNDSDGSIVFDLKCSDDNGVSVLQLWGNWSGWHANETNSTPVNDTYWNVTVNGIPEGVWKWDAWCNDTIGQEDWSAVNRTFTVDLTDPTASMGTNPVDYINDSDGNITFDLKCSDNFAPDVIQLWGNWSGSWAANETNSTPQNNTFWNKSVSGIPAGTYKWGVYCNDSSGREAWSANNRTLTVDLTDPQIGSKYINESGSVDSDTIVCLNVSGISDNVGVNTVWTTVTQSNGSVFNTTMSDTGSCAGSPGDNWYSVNVDVGDSAGLFSYNTTYVNDSSGRVNTNTTVLNLTVTVPVAPANVVVKTYTNLNYNETDKFYARNYMVFTEANVTNSSGGNITDATVTANFTISGSVENSTTLTKVCGDCSIYRGTWVTNATQTLGVYLVNVTATNVAGSKTDNNSMHLYSGSGVSAYEMDWDEDGTDDYVMENKHVISVFNKSAEDTNRLLSHIELKDTNVSFTFSDTSDTDSSHRGFIGTDGSKGWNFTNLSFTSTGESLSSVNLTMNAFDPEKPTKPTEQNTDSNALDENPEASGQGIIEIIMNILNEWVSVLQGIFQPAIPEHEPRLSALKTYFSQDENPEFVFEIQEAKEVSKSIEVVVYHMGKPVEIKPEVGVSEQGRLSITVPRARKFKPGLYTLKLTQNGETYETEFLWGVLAINTHKSIYLENEEAFIGIAVLDNEGRMVCDSEVTLEITDPHGTKTTLTTSDGTIQISPQCEFYGVTNLPDYYAYHTVSTEGTYTMNLTAITEDGLRTITDTFLVQKQVDFDVERDGPTRIYPIAKYTMNFEIKANKDFEGEINEYVPSSFVITPQDDLAITTTGDAKTLTWDKKLTAGETYQLTYEFDAPDISPYLFTLGPLEIGNWKEAREWMIASDAPDLEDLDATDCTIVVDEWCPDSVSALNTVEDPACDSSADNCLRIDRDDYADINLSAPTGTGKINNVTVFVRHDGENGISNYMNTSLVDLDTGGTLCYSEIPNVDTGWQTDNFTCSPTPTWAQLDNVVIRMTNTDSPGADDTYVEMVNVSIDYDTPPTWSDPNKNDSQIYTNDYVKFNTTWNDTLGLSGYKFSINQGGGWVNSSFVSFSGTGNVSENVSQITASGGTVVQWRFWANDTSGTWNVTDIQQFTVLNPLMVKSVTVTPQKVKNGTIINITANITDLFYSIDTAKAEIYYPNGSFWQNATMTNSGDIYYNETVTVSFYPPGRYNVTIWANDTIGNVNSSEKTWFIPYLNLSKKKNITINGSFEDWADVTNVSDVVGDSDAPSGTKSLTKNTSYQNNPDITMKEISAPVLNVSQEATINVTINVTNADPSETNGFSWSVNVSLWNTTQLNTLNISTWNQTNTSVSGYVLSVFPSDFDNDGDIDIVSGDWGDRIYILENPGNENSTDITTWNKTNALVGDNVNCVFAADLNNDGYNDIISGDDLSQVYIWENPGNQDSTNISAWSKTSTSASNDVDAVFAADIDNDGDIDIISGDYGQRVFIWENPGNSMDISEWSKTNTSTNYVMGVAAADINNDNYNDIISAEWTNDRITLWINPGNVDSTNISAWSKTSEQVSGDGESVATGDIDNDGDLDIIFGSGSVYIWENPGNENSTNITRWNYTSEFISGQVRAVAAADLDNDGDLDIISGDTNDQVYIWINPGNEDSTNISAWSKTNVPSGGSAYSVAAADLDNEGDNDIISVGGSNLVFIWENSDVASTYITSGVKTFVNQWGNATTYSLNWTPGNSGTYELMAIADNTGRHAEVLENNNKIVMEVELGLVPSDFDLETVSLANNDTYLFARFAVNGSIDLSTSTRYYGLYISTNGSTGNQTSYGGDATLPFSADYFVMVNGSIDCNVFNSSYDNIGGCNASNSSKQIELRVLLTLINTSTGDNVNITFETGGSSYDFAPDGESFLSYDAPGPPGDQSPTASLGTNPVPALNDSDGSIVFDLKCSDDIGVDVLELWGNWSGWHANETNSTPASNGWWNVTVNGIPEGMWKWDAWCNDTIGQGDWSAVNRTFTVDLTNPTAEMGTNPIDYINDSDGSITFDLKCSDNFDVDTLQLWGNWSGSWAANETNSTPGNNTFWNKSVSGIPAGTWKWGVYCNDSSGREAWSANNRTLTVDLTDPQIGSKYINESGSMSINTIVCLNVSGISDNVGVNTVWTTVTQSNGSVFNITMSDTGSCAGSPGDNWYSADVNVGDSAGTFYYNTTYVNDSSGRVNSNTTVLNLTVNPPSFNVTIEMRSEDVDYLVYHWLNFPSGDLGNLWSDVSGRFGSSMGDDRYHVGDGTDQKVEEASADQWTNYTTLTNKYIAVYDNSTTTDPANNTVLGWVHFENTSGADYKVVSIWNDSSEYGTRIKYNLSSMANSDKVVYLLVFSNGTWNTIDKWMSTINSGSYPTTNFMSSPGATITALGSFTGPATINENESTNYTGNCTCSGGSCDDVYIRIQDNRTGGWSNSSTTGDNVYVNVTSYSIPSPLGGTSDNYYFNVTGNSSGHYNFRVVCNTTSAVEDPSPASLLVVSACNVDFVMSSELQVGILFSEQDPSQVNVSAVDNGDYNVTDDSNSGCGTVNVSVRATSDLVNGSSLIGIGNVTVNSTSPDSETIQLSTTYQLIRSSVPAGTSNITTLYFWLTIPSGQDPRAYNTTIYIMEEME